MALRARVRVKQIWFFPSWLYWFLRTLSSGTTRNPHELASADPSADWVVTFSLRNKEFGLVGVGWVAGMNAKCKRGLTRIKIHWDGKADGHTWPRASKVHLCSFVSRGHPKEPKPWQALSKLLAFRTTMCEEHVPCNVHVPPDRLSCLPTSGASHALKKFIQRFITRQSMSFWNVLVYTQKSS